MKKFNNIFRKKQEESEGLDLYQEQFDLQRSKLIPRWFWKNLNLDIYKGLFIHDVVKDDNYWVCQTAFSSGICRQSKHGFKWSPGIEKVTSSYNGGNLCKDCA